MADRTELRTKVYRLHDGKCAWCGFPLSHKHFEVHEVFVKRGSVPVNKQHLIMVLENCVPLHPDCHREHGQSREMKQRCLDVLIEKLGAQCIGIWYSSLWFDHGLSVPRGQILSSSNWREYLEGVIGVEE